MIDGFVAAALTLSRATIDTGANERCLKRLQVNLPAEVFDRLERSAKNDDRFVDGDDYRLRAETVIIAGIRFVRSPV